MSNGRWTLAFAGLHQLCTHMLDHLDRLPDPQRAAIETAFGLSGGSPPDRFLVGLATLTLLSAVATNGRSSALSTTRNGSIGRRSKRSPSRRVG